MARLMSIVQRLWSLLGSLFLHPDLRDWLDIIFMTILIYQVLRQLMRTRANTVFKGIAIVLVLAWISAQLELHTLAWLLKLVVNTGIIVLVVLFQPELRRGLDQLGRSRFSNQVLSPRSRKIRKSEQTVQEIVRSLTTMARKRIGALIVIERSTRLDDIASSGTRLDAEISDALIQNIFEPNTPLHDGAVLIRDGRILAAACILQLTEDQSVSRELGTRHRAAIGMTESTDAVTLIVSEETGIISMAREGRLTRHMDARSLTVLLTELFSPERGAGSFRQSLMHRKEEQDEA